MSFFSMKKMGVPGKCPAHMRAWTVAEDETLIAVSPKPDRVSLFQQASHPWPWKSGGNPGKTTRAQPGGQQSQLLG